MLNIDNMSGDERRELIARLLRQHESDVLEACADCVRCDSCGKLVSKVTEGLQANDDFTEDCCDDCVIICQCGEAHSPSGSEHHAECGQGQKLTAKVFCTVAGDLSVEQADCLARIMKAYRMVPSGADWVSEVLYPMKTKWTFARAAQKLPGSFFTTECGDKLARIPLELVVIILEFVRDDGVIKQKLFDAEVDKRFIPPDDAGYSSLNFRVLMKVVARQ